jgi:hypothetical protein
LGLVKELKMSIPRNLGNFADNLTSTGTLNVGGINATGTPSSATVLAGNGSWVTPSAGALVYISTTTISSLVSSVDITSGFSSTYDNYIVLIDNLTAQGNTTSFVNLRIYKTGTLITSSTYNRSYTASYNNGPPSCSYAVNTTSGQILYNEDSAGICAQLQIFNANSNAYVYAYGTSLGSNCSNTQAAVKTSASGALTGIRIYSGSFSLTGGTFKLYGVAKA